MLLIVISIIPQAADIILSSALIDREEIVRYEATLQYIRHPKSDEMSDILSDFHNYTTTKQSPIRASKRRIKRFNIFDALSFRLQSPSFNWRRQLGSSGFGVSMGLIVRNVMELDVKPLSGRFEVDAYDEAYFVANIGYVGITLDIFRATVCYKGYISYNLNILQELGINSFSDLANIYDITIGAIVTSVKDAIENFRNVLGINIDISFIFDSLVNAVSELPFIVENLVVSPTLRRVLEQLKQLPFIKKGLMLIDEITYLYEEVRSDILMFYQEISDCVIVTLPWVGGTIKTAIETIGKSIEKFFRNPLIAIRDVIVSVFQLRSAIESVIDCKDTLISAANFQGAHIRGWMDLVNRVRGIYNATIETKNLIIMQARAFSEIRNASTFEKATGLNLTLLRMKAYNDLKVALEEFTQPLIPLLTIIEPFIDAYSSAVKVIRNVIQAYETFRDTYEKAKDLIERIFGPKFHRKFPKQIRGDEGCKQSNCQCGFYPTTSGNTTVYREGLQLEASIGDRLVAPTSGLYLRLPGNQVLIYPSGSFSKYVVMIHHVELIEEITYAGINVQSGDFIGTVTESSCEPNFIHFTVMTKSGKSVTNPFPFLQPRFLEIPKWIEECNDYKLIVRDRVIQQGNVIGKPDMRTKKARGSCTGGTQCTNANIPNGARPSGMKSSYKPKYQDSISQNSDAKGGLLPTASSNGPKTPSNRPIGANLANFLTKEQGEKFSESGGDFQLTASSGGDGFDFSVNSIKVGTVLDVLKNLGSSGTNQIVTTIEDTINYLREVLDCENDELIDPSLLDLRTIKNSLKLRGISVQGDREQLTAKLIELPTGLCPGIQDSIPQNRWCSISDDCLTLKCAAALKMDFISYSVVFSITLDPCAPSIILKFQDLEKVIDLPDIYGGFEINIASESIELLGIASLNLDVRLMREDFNIILDFKAYLCNPDESSDDFSHCFIEVELVTGAGFTIPNPLNCTSNERKRNIRQSSSSVTSCGIQIPDFREMTLSEFVTYIKDLGSKTESSTNNINQLMQDLRNVFLTDLINAIISGESPVTSEETDFPTTFDICVTGSFALQRAETFFSREKLTLIGPVPVRFRVSLDGYYGVDVTVRLCFISMVASAEAVPSAGLVLTGSAAVEVAVFAAGVKLIGKILDSSLPIQPYIGFKQFPLAIKLRVDFELVPLSISIRFFLSIEINLLFYSYTKELIDEEIFHWSAPTISVNLLDITNIDQDQSPPQFSLIAESEESQKVRRISKRSSISESCSVNQVAGRDYTDPAFILQINVADDKSQVKLTYSVGTYPGGADVIRDDRMNGNTVLIARQLISSLPLYWTARASNSQGASTASQCSLQTYDTTLPIGRVDFREYVYSSHQSVLIGETTIIDDTNIIKQLHAIGYGVGPFGDQTVTFTSFDFDVYTPKSTSLGLEDFILIANKRLGVVPFKVGSGIELQDCVSDCIQFPTKCFSFNYAIVPRICELLNYIAGDSSLEFEYDAQYSYYEKQGVGSHASFTHENLPLVHNTLYFLNIFLVNELLYERYLHSPGMLIDFTPPEPGLILNAVRNETRHDGCTAAFNQRCEPPEYVTSLEYHNLLQDGPGSECVYNGPIVGTDLMYTRLNSFLSIVFQDFHDTESGKFFYNTFPN